MPKQAAPEHLEFAAANGLLDRRLFLRSGAGLATLGYALREPANAAPLPLEPWMTAPNGPVLPYDRPSRFESKVVRGGGGSRTGFSGVTNIKTPLHLLTGTITPAGLHHARLHSGVPDIDPDKHELLIHGLVKRPLIFTVEALSRYPLESHIYFHECGGNSEIMYDEKPSQAGVMGVHGQISCSEWTGVRLAMLMEEAGVDPKAKWILAEGADASAMTRSVPMEKVMKDALIALYQNGERVMPSNGYPMRLLLPGFEGNMQVKWLRRVKALAGPTESRDETSKYTMTHPDGKSTQFNLYIEAKSVITQPAPELKMRGPGFYEISGLAWSGYGKIVKVEVSADGGKSWAPARLEGPGSMLAMTRFRIPWQWDGGPAVLQSRATDNTGYVQPTRAALIAKRGPWANYHANMITSWSIASNGDVTHVYA
ncbi:MAG TPA: sulfite dehydrogenase [Candidatus Binatia bacterium]|nr:sulfite dehydrogenase [Candidatus Binatia bacterium]